MAYTGGRIIATYKLRYDGSEILDYHNEHREIPRDQVIGSLLPPVICKCAISRGAQPVCLRDATVAKIARAFKVASGSAIEETMRGLMKATGCSSEVCVLKKASESGAISVAEAGIEEQIAFKQSGPTDITLFNDSVIGAQLYAWMYQFPSFWAYNFNMLNYTAKSLRSGRVVKSPDTLATVNWREIVRDQKVPQPVDLSMTSAAKEMLAQKSGRIRCGACVINSDVYDGGGKHWMALFVDARDTSANPRWTIEFFNSAAVQPESEWMEWMVKTKRELLEVNPQARVEFVLVCKIWHQHSKTECGPYSLFYVWARLNNIPPSYFLENVVPDQIIFEFRQHLFGTSQVGEKFDFAQFANTVKIKWESEKH